MTEARDAVQSALADGVPLHIQGGGSKPGLGEPVEGRTYTVEAQTIRFYEPEEMVIRMDAGTPLAEVEATLAKHKQTLAFEPPRAGALYGNPDAGDTMGGVVAANWAGPRRLSQGAVGDHLLGVAGVTGRGAPFTAGGRVIKNVTGYDVNRLMTGSHGSLAVLTELTFRTIPLPAYTCSLAVEGLALEEALALMRTAIATPLAVSGAVYLPSTMAAASHSRTLMRLESHRREGIDEHTQALAALCPPTHSILAEEESTAFWQELRDFALFPFDETHVWQVNLPPTHMAEAVNILAVPPARWYVDWGGSVLRLALPPTPPAAVHTPARARGGHALLLRGDTDTRRHAFPPLPAVKHALTARIKEAFDPEHILNRGRMNPVVLP